MKIDVSEKKQLFGLWCGVGFFVLFFLAVWPLSGFIPPPSPTLTGVELVSLYSDNIFMIRASMVVGLISAILIIPWSAVLAIQVARIEGRIPFMAITAFGAGIANSVAFYLPFIFWSAAFYRLDRDAELIRLLNDLTWLEFVMVFPPWVLQVVVVALAGLSYKGTLNIFPRWFCFMSLWIALLVLPGGIAIFFYTGPFAWNGLIAFWIPVVVFSLYYVVAFPLVYKAIKSHAESEAS